MSKELKLFNGIGYCCRKTGDERWSGRREPPHAFVAAFSRADARRVIAEYTGQLPPDSELRDYWSEGAWGRAMAGITPERGLWVEFKGNEAPVRVWPEEPEKIATMAASKSEVREATLDSASAFFERHNAHDPLMSAFEANGGCGHDIGLEGLVGILREWECIRTPAMIADLTCVDQSALADLAAAETAAIRHATLREVLRECEMKTIGYHLDGAQPATFQMPRNAKEITAAVTGLMDVPPAENIVSERMVQLLKANSRLLSASVAGAKALDLATSHTVDHGNALEELIWAIRTTGPQGVVNDLPAHWNVQERSILTDGKHALWITNGEAGQGLAGTGETFSGVIQAYTASAEETRQSEEPARLDPPGVVLAFPGMSEAEAEELIATLRFGGNNVLRVPVETAAQALLETENEQKHDIEP